MDKELKQANYRYNNYKLYKRSTKQRNVMCLIVGKRHHNLMINGAYMCSYELDCPHHFPATFQANFTVSIVTALLLVCRRKIKPVLIV